MYLGTLNAYTFISNIIDQSKTTRLFATGVKKYIREIRWITIDDLKYERSVVKNIYFILHRGVLNSLSFTCQ